MNCSFAVAFKSDDAVYNIVQWMHAFRNSHSLMNALSISIEDLRIFPVYEVEII